MEHALRMRRTFTLNVQFEMLVRCGNRVLVMRIEPGAWRPLL
jgi:hypothetical protein